MKATECRAKMAEIRDQVGNAPDPDASPLLAAYLEKVRLHAYAITDGEVAALLAAGMSEDALYAATMRVALAAGIDRFDTGLRALREAKPRA